jgi:hypothetical protein
MRNCFYIAISAGFVNSEPAFWQHRQGCHIVFGKLARSPPQLKQSSENLVTQSDERHARFLSFYHQRLKAA